MKKWIVVSLFLLTDLFGVSPPTTVGSTGPLYALGFHNLNVYSIDVQAQTFSIIGNITGASGLSNITLLDRNTAYISGQSNHALYQMDLENGSFTTVASFPLDFYPIGIGILDEKTAYITGYSQDVYKLNRQTNQISLFSTIPSSLSLAGIQILNDSTAYITDTDTNTLYSVDLKTGAATIVATFPISAEILALQLANNTTAYVSGGTDANIYAVDLTTGGITLITPLPVGSPVPNLALFGLSLDENTLYTPNYSDSTMFSVNRNTGLYSSVVTIPGSNLNWASRYLQMVTEGLSGNNLDLANYLNANAPLYVIRSFALQANGLPIALEAASPARNAFSTYAAQNAYLASSQLLIDHSRRIRVDQKIEMQSSLSADASDVIVNSTSKKQCQPMNQTCKNKKQNIWFTPFGEYAREKAQMQTPAFTLSVGGGLLGYDYTNDSGNTFGVGGSYVYTHVHQAHGMGHANINQGFGTAYTTLRANNWYSDISIWGGYYSSSNTRNIAFPGVDAKAKATIHGWQTAAHLETGYSSVSLSDCKTKFEMEPFAMGDWVGNWEHSFHEHGAGSLNMGQKGRFASFLRAESGLRFYEVIQFDSGDYLVFREKGSYAYQKAFNTGNITAFLIGSPGTFTATTLTGAQNLGVFEFSLLYHRAEGIYFDVRYQGEYGSKYWSNQGMFEIGWDF